MHLNASELLWTKPGRQGVVEMEAGGECGAWKEIGKHDYNTPGTQSFLRAS